MTYAERLRVYPSSPTTILLDGGCSVCWLRAVLLFEKTRYSKSNMSISSCYRKVPARLFLLPLVFNLHLPTTNSVCDVGMMQASCWRLPLLLCISRKSFPARFWLLHRDDFFREVSTSRGCIMAGKAGNSTLYATQFTGTINGSMSRLLPLSISYKTFLTDVRL